MKEHVWHLRRHLAAREPLFIGREIMVPGTQDTSLVGNGIHPDHNAHLQASEYQKAEEIGETLYVPEGVSSVLIAHSPLVRADETARHMFVGMARAYACNVLGIDPDELSSEDKKKLSGQGLHKLAAFQYVDGLVETWYRDSDGDPDEGDELVAEAYHKGVNPGFSGYRWMMQKGFEGDPRSEHPKRIADRGLEEAISLLLQYDVVLSVSHQPNLEVITAALRGRLGNNGNELFEEAGGAYGLGDGFELRLYETEGDIKAVSLGRTEKSSREVGMKLKVNFDVLKKYLH